MKKINIAIIGCGHWGPNFIRNFSQMPGVRVAGICDYSSDRLAHFKALYGKGLQSYSNYRSLLNKNDLDAVIVSTPATTHYKITKDALEAGKHVLVEKPLSTNSRDAEELVRVADKSRKIMMVGHTFLFNPAVNKIREILQKRQLGKIYYIHSRRTNLGPLRKDVDAIWDLSPHDISIINYLLDGLPVEVSAQSQRFLSHSLDDVGFITLKYPKDILAHIHVSWLDPKKIRETTIIGSKKMLVYDDISVEEPIRVYDKKVMRKKYEKAYNSFEEFQLIIRDGRMSVPKVKAEEPLKKECQHFIDCVREDRRPLSDSYEGLNIVRILEEIDKSSSEARGNGVKIKWE